MGCSILLFFFSLYGVFACFSVTGVSVVFFVCVFFLFLLDAELPCFYYKAPFDACARSLVMGGVLTKPIALHSCGLGVGDICWVLYNRLFFFVLFFLFFHVSVFSSVVVLCMFSVPVCFFVFCFFSSVFSSVVRFRPVSGRGTGGYITEDQGGRRRWDMMGVG